MLLLYCGGQANRISKLFNNIRLVISPRDKIRCTLAHTHTYHTAYGKRVVGWWWCYGSILISTAHISICTLTLTNNQQQSDGKIEYIISTKQTNYAPSSSFWYSLQLLLCSTSHHLFGEFDSNWITSKICVFIQVLKKWVWWWCVVYPQFNCIALKMMNKNTYTHTHTLTLNDRLLQSHWFFSLFLHSQKPQFNTPTQKSVPQHTKTNLIGLYALLNNLNVFSTKENLISHSLVFFSISNYMLSRMLMMIRCGTVKNLITHARIFIFDCISRQLNWIAHESKRYVYF